MEWMLEALLLLLVGWVSLAMVTCVRVSGGDVRVLLCAISMSLSLLEVTSLSTSGLLLLKLTLPLLLVSLVRFRLRQEERRDVLMEGGRVKESKPPLTPCKP